MQERRNTFSYSLLRDNDSITKRPSIIKDIGSALGEFFLHLKKGEDAIKTKCSQCLKLDFDLATIHRGWPFSQTSFFFLFEEMGQMHFDCT